MPGYKKLNRRESFFVEEIQELRAILKRANDMINDSYQCECGNTKTPCPCLEGFLDNIQAILEQS